MGGFRCNILTPKMKTIPFFPVSRDNIDHYCLMIAEEDGEVDEDFPALDNKEAISKFGFNTLSLVEKEPVIPTPENSSSGKEETIIVNM